MAVTTNGFLLIVRFTDDKEDIIELFFRQSKKPAYRQQQTRRWTGGFVAVFRQVHASAVFCFPFRNAAVRRPAPINSAAAPAYTAGTSRRLSG